MKLLLAFLVTFISIVASAANSGVTYQGRIMKPDGSPLAGQFTQFKLQLRTPDSQNCLMYEEIQSQDLRNSNGIFSLTINDGSGSRTDSTALTLDRIFANRGTFTLDPLTCSAGVGTYAPNSADGRNLVVLFKDETMSTWEPIPAQKINFVPFAFDSKQVSGFAADSLIRVVNGSGDPLTGLAPLSNAQYTELMALVNGTSNAFTKAGQLGGVALPTMTSGEVLGWNGTAWVSQPSVAGPNSVTTAMIQNSAVDSTKIASGAVGTSQIASNVTINTTGTIGSAITTTRDFKIFATSPSSFYVGMVAPALAASYSLTWPMDDGAAGEVLTTNGSGVLSWAPAAASSQWTTHASNISYDGGGNVGIGTTSPGVPLDVVGDINTSTAYYGPFSYVLRNLAGTGSATNPSYSFTYGNSTGFFLNGNGSDTIGVSTAGAERMRIDQTGKVGIGTTSPVSTLDVNGRISIAGLNGLSFPADSVAGGSVAIGAQALRTQPSLASTNFQNTAVGYNSISSASMTAAAVANTAVGYNAAASITSGGYNTAFGANSGSGFTTGSANTAIGYGALSINTTSSGNTGVGYYALAHAGGTRTGYQNTGVGGFALYGADTANSNVALGYEAGRDLNYGSANVAIGVQSLSRSYTGGGSNNAFLGFQTGYNVGAASSNAGLGFKAGFDLTSGNNNVILGSYPTTGAGITTGSNNILIGTDLRLQSQSGSNQLNVGNLLFATGLGSGNTLSTGKVGIGTTAPSALLTLKAGSASAGTAPLKFSNGPLLSTPEDGAVEYEGTGLWFTIGSTRYVIPTNTAAGNYSNVTTISNSAGSITMTPMAGNSVIVNQSTTSTNSTSGALIVTGGVGVGGALNTAGNIVSGGSITATTNGIIPQLYGSTAASGNIKIDGTSNGTVGNVYLASAGGKVGIGTTSPNELLEVNGAVKIGNTVGANAGTLRWTGVNFQGYDGSSWFNIIPNPPAAGSCNTTQLFNASGVHSYTVPASFGSITVKMWGGGGGGAANGVNGAPGASSTSPSLGLVAGGGGPGLANASGGAGGISSGGTINLNGAAGASGDGTVGGTGGNSPNGGVGGLGGNSAAFQSGFPGTSPGGGGGGYDWTATGGGGGAGGYVEKTFTPMTLAPGTTINDLFVGTGGLGGINNVNGGNGGTGQISVTCSTAGAPPVNDRSIVFQSGGTYSSSPTLVYDSSGSVGIGTSSPVSTLNVQGAIVSNTVTNAAGVTNINFAAGNVQVSNNSTNNAAFNVCGLQDGGSYTLVLKAQPVGSAPTFTAYSDSACTVPITYVDTGGVSLTTSTVTTLVTFIRTGSTVYAMIATGFIH